ncbi:HNH endonuclease signature motif containing protein [Agromyces silvae]|uniref:HNH endonuclease signature motif containing protein n=1 Tax=Agromyces silvae TaxID=3388266 RepID=UPI00280BD92C|nr:DUF222 domain-containing protein [Agromyces protaetiae]
MQDMIPPPADIGSHVEAQAELAALIDASVELRQALARLDAQRLVSIHEAIQFAVSRARSFVSSHLGRTGQYELARRAVIAELAVAWRVSERTMQRLASESYMLCTALPSTLAAMSEGEIDAAHVRVIVEAVSAVEGSSDALARADAELASLARGVTPAKLRHDAKRLLEQVQIETVVQRHERAFADRAVQLEPAPDGMAWLAVQMRATDALLVRDRLKQAVTVAKADASESRTCAQLEADLARDLLLYGAPVGDAAAGTGLASIRPTVHVTVPVLSLLGLDESPADLDGYGPIDAETARRLAANAPSFTRLLTHPISGAVLDVDRGSYRVPADLRTWLQVRDRTCRFPGCTRRAVRCEVDHSAAWAADHGATAHDNLAHLCAFHHHLKHETAWSLRHLDGGVLEWTSLTGAVYRTTPEGDLRAGSLQQAIEAARRAFGQNEVLADAADPGDECGDLDDSDSDSELAPAPDSDSELDPDSDSDSTLDLDPDPDPDSGRRPGLNSAHRRRRRPPAVYEETVGF